MAEKRPELTPEQAAIELLRRRRARDSLMGFAEAIKIPSVPADDDLDRLVFEPVGSEIAQHHRVFMSAIEECMTTRYGRLIIMAPPGSAKSSYGSVVGPVWYMGKFPGARIILQSYGEDLAKRHGQRAREVVGQQAFSDIFGTTISDSTSAKDEWHLTNGSEYLAGSLKGGTTGNRANGVVIDDPVKGKKEAESPVERQATQHAYDYNVDSRLLPGAWVILILTRWHPEDLAGTILPENYAGQSGKIKCRDGRIWNVVRMPAECDSADDPLGRHMGDAEGGVPGSMIWEEYFDPEHWISKRKDKKVWASLYQQSPTIDGEKEFDRAWVKWYTPGDEPKSLTRFIASDYAVKEDQKADFTEHGVGGLDYLGHLWITDWWFGQKELDVTVPEFFAMSKQHDIRQGFAEKGVIQHATESVIKLVRKELEREGDRHARRVEVEYLSHIGDKVAKFQAFKRLAMSGKVHIPDNAWGRRLVDLLEVFPDSRYHDDAPDVCAHMGRAAADTRWVTPRREPSNEPDLKFGTWKWLTWGTEKKEGGDGPRLF